MKLGSRSLLFVCAFAACGPAHSRIPAVATVDGAKDVAAAIARVEHGLGPSVQIAGERGAWSIEERMRALHVPGVSIAVIHDHRVAWAKAYGVADVRSGRRLDVDTRFEAASISKMLTGIVALQLVDRGKVALDADINQALQSWKLPENELTRGHPVTLRQLLSHTGGINLHTVLGYAPDETLPTLPQILDGVPPANTAPVRVEYVPGKEFHYSGGGLLIVQQLIVELFVLQPFAEVMQAQLLAPLGLRHTTFALRLSPDERAHSATAHDNDESVWPDRIYPDAAPAGLWTTPSDLARLLVEVQRGLDGQSALISRPMAQAMTTPIAPIGVPDVWTAAGTFVERHGHTMYFGHDGHNEGYLSMSRATTTGSDGAVVMTNSEGGAELIFEIMRSIAAEYHWDGWLEPPIQPVVVDAARLRGFVGRYAVGLDRAVQVSVQEGQLELREPFAEPRRMVAIGGDAFISRSDGARVEFRAGGQLVETSDGAATTLTRVSDAVVEPLRQLEAGGDAAARARYVALLAAHPADAALAEARFDDLASDLLDRRFDAAHAIQVFEVEAALYPSSANAQAGLALAYLHAGRRADAATAQARATALYRGRAKGPEMVEAYLGMRMSRLARLGGASTSAR